MKEIEKLWEELDLRKIRPEELKDEEKMQELAVLIAILEHQAKTGRELPEKELQDKAHKWYVRLLLEKLKRYGLINATYSDNGRDIKAKLSEKGKKAIALIEVIKKINENKAQID